MEMKSYKMKRVNLIKLIEQHNLDEELEALDNESLYEDYLGRL